jgi:MarR family transcriptional regulator, transcriptional regulator for hemolysin
MKSSATRTKSRKRSVAVKLTVVARRLRMTFDRRAERKGLTRAQWAMITAVARQPGATQKELADALEVREMTAARLVDRLCEEGYLERRNNPRHHRAYGVHLTAAATPLIGKLDEIAQIHEAATFAGFGSKDLEKLDSMLDLIANNLAQL